MVFREENPLPNAPLPQLIPWGFLRAIAIVQLHIEERPVVLQCQKCGKRYSAADFHQVACPDCGAPEYAIVQGNELYIDSFEGE